MVNHPLRKKIMHRLRDEHLFNLLFEDEQVSIALDEDEAIYMLRELYEE